MLVRIALCVISVGFVGRLEAADVVRLPLPAPATQMVVGGEGRYLVLAMVSAKSVMVVDLLKPSTDRVLKAQSEPFVVAANRTELIIADNVTTAAARYRLSDGKLIEKNLMFPGKYLYFIGMGPSSDGPVWVEARNHGMNVDNVSVLDSKTLRKVEHLIGRSRHPDDPKLEQESVRDRSSVSDDGTTFSGNHVTVQIRGKEPSIRQTVRSRGAPSFDGNWLLDRFPPVPTDQSDPTITLSNRKVIPGRCSTLFASIDPSGDEVVVRVYDLAQFEKSRTLPEPIGSVSLPSIAEPVEDKPAEDKPSRPTKERRRTLELMARAGVVARLENGNQELALYRIELQDGWLKANSVNAIPRNGHCHAHPGVPVDYRISVPAGCAVGQYRLIAGPVGMTVSDRGRIGWTPPKMPVSQEAEALVEITGVDGATLAHRVVMTVGKAVQLDRLRKPIGVPGPMPLKMYGEMTGPQASEVGANVDPASVTRLPSSVGRVEVGSGGDFLIMELLDLQSLGIYDVAAGKMRALLSHNADAFAASADSIFLAYRDERKIERWSIQGLQKLDEVTLSEYIVPTHIAIGNQDKERLVVHTAHRRVDAVQILDATDLDRAAQKLPGNQRDRANILDVSANGELIVVRATEPSRIFCYTIVDGRWNVTTHDEESAIASTTGDGAGLVTDAGLVPIPADAVNRSRLGRRLWPAATGSLGLMVPTARSLRGAAQPIDHLVVVNLKTGELAGVVKGLFDVGDGPGQQAWLLPQRSAVVQLDPTRTMLIRKLVELPQ